MCSDIEPLLDLTIEKFGNRNIAFLCYRWHGQLSSGENDHRTVSRLLDCQLFATTPGPASFSSHPLSVSTSQRRILLLPPMTALVPVNVPCVGSEQCNRRVGYIECRRMVRLGTTRPMAVSWAHRVSQYQFGRNQINYEYLPVFAAPNQPNLFLNTSQTSQGAFPPSTYLRASLTRQKLWRPLGAQPTLHSSQPAFSLPCTWPASQPTSRPEIRPRAARLQFSAPRPPQRAPTGLLACSNRYPPGILANPRRSRFVFCSHVFLQQMG